MRLVARLAAAVLLAGAAVLGPLALAPASAQNAHLRDELPSAALRLEATLKNESAAFAGRPAAELARQADAFMAANDARAALPLYGAAIAAAPRSTTYWRNLARALVSVQPRDGSERWRLVERANAAAFAAFERASSTADQALALRMLGDVYARRNMMRPALDAWRASLARDDNPQLRAHYVQMREKHGFRIVANTVDSDAASPRACFGFSEALIKGRDYAPFVAVAGAGDIAVTAEGEQVCVDGLRHGERYAIVIRQGLPSAVEEDLLKPADYEIYVRDRSPQVRFTGRNYVLPRVGQEGIPVVSVNADEVEVEILRIGDRNLLPTLRSDDFLSQIGPYAANAIKDEKGFRVWSGKLSVKSQLNRDAVTAFPVMEAVKTLEAGVYVMTARPAGGTPPDEDYSTRATQWFVVSDLGLTAISGSDGVHVIVRSLADAGAKAGVEVRLIAKNNEVLASAATDANGHVRFDPGLSRGQGGLSPGLLVASDGKGDYGFLDLSANAFDLTDRGVKGRVAPRGLDAFVVAERGVYRPGETVFLTALLRDAAGRASAGLPLTLVVTRPDGIEYRRVSLADEGQGGRALSLPLLSAAQRGTWRVAAHADPHGPAIGETTFLVEDYVPETIEVEIKPRSALVAREEPVEIDVSARHLYGAPGADLEVSGSVTLRLKEDGSPPGLPGYVSGLDDEDFSPVQQDIEETASTDADGRATLRVTLPEGVAPRPAEARIEVRVGEPGGRAVERSVTVAVRPSGPVIGVKKLFDDSGLAEGAQAAFDIAAVLADGRRIARTGATWNLYRIERRYQWFNSDGRWGFEPVTTTRRIADGRIDIPAEGAARLTVPVGWGRHRLEIRAAEADGGHTSVSFGVGWGGDATADSPDLMDMKLDKAAYRAGETISVRLNPRFAGKATLAVVGDKVHDLILVDVAAEGSTVTLPAKPEYGPGAYLVAFAHRPLDTAARRMPGRALGLAWFALDREARTLPVSLGVEQKIRPRGQMRIPVRVGGLSPGEEAFVTVAAVDLGILNLTRYQAPRPSEHYLGQRQLSGEIRDLYGLLIDGLQGTRGAIRAGGDGAAPKLEGEPPAQEPLARYSGVVRVGPDGTADISFDIPAFNGTVRVMAMAWSKDRVGEAQADVIVRDPVVVAGTLPRFLNIGDRTRLHLAIDNLEGAAGEYSFEVDLRGPVVAAADALARKVPLAVGQKTQLEIPLTAAGIGTASLELRIKGPGLDVAQAFPVRIEPGSPAIYRRSVRDLAAGASARLTADVLADLLPGTGAVSVAISPAGAIDVPALLQALDRYPYGCSEQIVSRALPLLYVNTLAATERLAEDEKADEKVKDAILRVLSRQDSTGSFGLWSVESSADLWLDAFVSDFLTRARERGFEVPQKAFSLALDRLRNHVANASGNNNEDKTSLAYAIYVLARNGRPVMGDLRYFADTKLSEFTSPLARAQLGAALALLGDKGRADRAFGSAIEALRGTRDAGVSRPDYGSRLRDGAGLLALASEANAPRERIMSVGAIVEEAREASRYTSTQENAWMVLAAQAMARQGDQLSLAVDGAPHAGSLFRRFRETALERGVTLENRGNAPVKLVVTTSGHPATQEPATAQGYAVERTFYKPDGTKVDPDRVRQTDRLVVVLKITEPEAKFARLLVVDHLPAGFEIDNPNLVEGGSTEALSFLKSDVTPAHTEYRDDRFVAAFDRSPRQQAFIHVAYMVRAVTPGSYVLPPATAEDMYRPERFGRTGYGRVEVVPAR
jgi:uncharacterized protein YfaS (alpha-2-macroglobulin family)